jgi:CheY-like chemotaxis protein
MSHELRTPLNAVLGYAELLNKEIQDPAIKNYVDSIRNSGKSLLALINDILDLSKIEAGKFNLEYNFVDTQFFFSELECFFSLRIEEKGVAYLLEISPDLPRSLFVDEFRLRQIIVNLIGNAVKFTEKGKIILRAFIENIESSVSGEFEGELRTGIVIEVEDTGMGIEPTMQEVIFEPFEQVREFRNYGGTGLGLAISRKLAALMNGTLTLRSQPGIGSVFTLRIPEVIYSNEAISPPDKLSDLSEIRFGDAVVLIVDDVASNRSYLVDALKGTPIKTYEAENGIVGFEIAKKMLPDVIISDIRMPVLDGFGLLEKLKEDSNTSHIPVIACSASVFKGQKEGILNRDFAGLLIKPVNIRTLFEELMKFIPYTNKDEAGGKVALENTKDKPAVTDMEGLIICLQEDFAPRWEKFSVIQPMNQVELFGIELMELGEKHNVHSISEYGRKVKEAAAGFDIESVLDLLKKFPELTSHL